MYSLYIFDFLPPQEEHTDGTHTNKRTHTLTEKHTQTNAHTLTEKWGGFLRRYSENTS